MAVTEKSRSNLNLGAPWTKEEDAVLVRAYRKGGSERSRAAPIAQAELPHRTAQAISARARVLCLVPMGYTAAERHKNMQESLPAVPLGRRPARCPSCGGCMLRENHDPPRYYCIACGQDDYRGV